MNSDKLSELGKIWGKIKYFNPYIHLNKVDWNGAFSVCYDKLKNSAGNEFMDIVHEYLLSRLDDPLARVEFSDTSGTGLGFDNAYKLNSDSVIILTINDWANENVNELLKKAIDNRQKAKGLIIDLRNLNEEKEKNIYDDFSNLKFFRYFCAAPLKRTTDLEMEYEGFPNEKNPEEISFYKSFFKCQNKPSLSAIPESVNIPIIMITGQYDPLSSDILDLRNNNKCRIIAVKNTFVNIYESIAGIIETKYGKISFSKSIPVFSNSRKPIYADLIIDESNNKKILKLALKQIEEFNDFSESDEFIDITTEIKMDRDFNENSFPSEAERVMAVTKLYSVIKYFFPHKEHMDKNWDEVYSFFVPKAIQCTDRNNYIEMIKEMSTFLNDSHVFLFYKPNEAIRKIPITAIYIENKMIITELTDENFQSLHKIEIGDEIIEINGKSIKCLIQKNRKLISASRNETFFRDLMWISLLGTINSPFSLTLLSKDGLRKTVVGKYGEYLISESYKKKLERSIKEITDNILYVRLYTLSDIDTEELETKLAKFQNVIFDLRGYPSYPQMFTLLKQLCHNEIFDWGSYKIPITSYTSDNEDNNFVVFKTSFSKMEAFPKFKNKIVVLVNNETQSYAEAISDALRVNSDAVLIGSNTAGANGNVSFISLPGNLKLMFSQMIVLLKNGTSMQNVGLCPDIEVRPTIDGISKGKDELVEKAIEYFNDKCL
ncbi:MAG TPA: S41 family peptidase [Candidatus Cloacimonadota bacterium]|nr:S41 family peptidase [Candidatus Cloacimonadota bacterium]